MYNYQNSTKENPYTQAQFLQDFSTGFISSVVGDLVSVYGVKGVKKAFKKIGFQYKGDLSTFVKGNKLVDNARDILETLSKNTGFKRYYDDLLNNPSTRKFKNVLSIEEETVLKFYTADAGYKKFNQALRGEIAMTDEFIAQEKLMNQALKKLPNSSYNDLYRIENLTESQITTIYKEGGVITSKAFTSSTYSEEALIDAMRSRPHSLLIRMKGKNGKIIEDLSTLPKEKEVLFQSGTKFRINKVGYSANPNDDYMTKIRTVWLEEL